AGVSYREHAPTPAGNYAGNWLLWSFLQGVYKSVPEPNARFQAPCVQLSSFAEWWNTSNNVPTESPTVITAGGEMDSRRDSMRTKSLFGLTIGTRVICWAGGVLGILSAQLAMAQAHNRISELSDTNRVTMYGNVHPLARAQYDQGRVPGSIPMRRITLVFN